MVYLSIITLTYNNIKYTKQYIESLYKYTKNFELIIVDNGSTDGTVEYIESLKYNNIKLIKNSENLGFSKGNNQAIKIAEGEFIGFLNNDILLYPNWFEECEKVFSVNNAGFVSPREIIPDMLYDFDQNYISYFKSLHYDSNCDISYKNCSFSCVITKKNILDKIGLFNENYYPAYFEDDDMKCRAIELGLELYVANKACFYHHNAITGKNNNYNFEKNKKLFWETYKYGKYLYVDKQERYDLLRLTNIYNMFPLKLTKKMLLFVMKIKNKLLRGFKK